MNVRKLAFTAKWARLAHVTMEGEYICSWNGCLEIEDCAINAQIQVCSGVCFCVIRACEWTMEEEYAWDSCIEIESCAIMHIQAYSDMCVFVFIIVSVCV